MADEQGRDTEQDRDRRNDDRRGGDRRRPDRRATAPLWRRPWAYALYGVAGAFLIVVVSRMIEEDEPEVLPQVVNAAPAVDTTTHAGSTGPLREAMGTGEFERLLAQGEGAAGQRVITTLFCEEVASISLTPDQPTHPSVAALADANARVPGADCKWGDEDNAPDLLLVVPPALAPRLAAAPSVQQNFVDRRRIRAEVEWVGRADALALRNVGVLRAVQ